MRFILAASIVIGLVAGTQRVCAQSLVGTDTLLEVTQQLIAACPGAAGLTYRGGGSGVGESAIVSGTQQIAPMSRTMIACGGSAAASDGLVFGTAAIMVVTGSERSESCGGGHVARMPNVAPTAPFSDFAGAGDAWKQTLRTLYAGRDGSGSPAMCGAADRRDLVANYANIFQGGCSSAPDCGFTRSGTHIASNGFRHLFRRDEHSEPTDSFRLYVGQINSFCNGVATKSTQADGDPIRRDCSDEESVCQADGTLGLLLAITVPELNGGSSTLDDDGLWYRTTAGDPNSVRGCEIGRFARRPTSFRDGNCCMRARAGNLSSACVARPQFGLCYRPVSSDGLPCNNGLDRQCFDHNINAADFARGVRDSRAYNLQVNNPNPPFDVASDQSGGELATSFFRLYWTRAGVNYNGTNGQGSLCPTIDRSSLCQQTHSDSQVGCFANKVQCNLGYASDQARRVSFAEPFAFNAEDPFIGSNLNDAYPLSRNLFLATRMGLENTIGNQRALAECFANNAQAAPNNINGILLANNFFPAFNPITGSRGDPYCTDYCGAPDACLGNPPPFQNP